MQVNQTQADMSALLQQMRAMRAHTQNQAQQISVPDAIRSDLQVNPGVKTPEKTEFGSMLESAVQTVNQLQKTSATTTNDFVMGKENDLVKVMIDSQKASLGFQAMVQTRNRFVTAYQDIMNMPI